MVNTLIGEDISKKKLPEGRLAAFTYLYEKKLLGNHETISGAGSLLMCTRAMRYGLETMLAGRRIGSVLDIGCGDANWTMQVNWQGIAYTGIDLVEPLIRKNRAEYAAPNICFQTLDAVESELPKADAVLCHDLFTHLPRKDITTILQRISENGARFLFATTHDSACFGRKVKESWGKILNADSPPGYWRPVNLCQPPFNLPPPDISLRENEQGKSFDLWQVHRLRTFL